jgi:hypothetical protein
LIAGVGWNDEISDRLEEMDIFLFIASQRSLVQPYIKNVELKRAKERKNNNEIEFVTVKLEPCAVDEDKFIGKLQRLASTERSIAEARLRARAWEQVRLDLIPVIKRVKERKMKEQL